MQALSEALCRPAKAKVLEVSFLNREDHWVHLKHLSGWVGRLVCHHRSSLAADWDVYPGGSSLLLLLGPRAHSLAEVEMACRGDRLHTSVKVTTF